MHVLNDAGILWEGRFKIAALVAAYAAIHQSVAFRTDEEVRGRCDWRQRHGLSV
jgi:uncharacterized membrane protein